MTEPSSTSVTSLRTAGGRASGFSSPPPSGQTWFRTRGGRLYGRELGLVIVVKAVALAVLWLVFIQPWPRAGTAPATVVEHFYVPVAPAGRHD